MAEQPTTHDEVASDDHSRPAAPSPQGQAPDPDLLATAENVSTPDEFKAWTRDTLRPILPHGALACGLGHIHACGVALDYIIAVDYPIAHLEAIRNKAGAIDTPILRRWMATREPQLFDGDAPWPDVPPAWLEHFVANDLRNAAAHACYDAERCIGIYFSFHRLPPPLGPRQAEALVRIVPVMHEVLYRVVQVAERQNDFATRLATLTGRERDILQWLRLGKSNGEIASIADLSEVTVKHHLTRIYQKLAVESRAQLVGKLGEQDALPAPGYGTKLI